jgi:hypothetical protein
MVRIIETGVFYLGWGASRSHAERGNEMRPINSFEIHLIDPICIRRNPKMDDLVKTVSEKTGLSEDMAKQVVDVVLDYVKGKLPDSIAGQVDAFLEGGSPDLGGLAGGLGGLLG